MLKSIHQAETVPVYRAGLYSISGGTLHYEGRWECTDFDSEAGHSCAHCGARYTADHHEPVGHEENCPHSEAP